MRYLSYEDVLRLYDAVMRSSGGSPGIRDDGLLRSAIAQPRMSFGGAELYATLAEKCAALGFSLVKNHPFVDGNKRIALAAVDAFLRLNGLKLTGTDDELVREFLALAAGEVDRTQFTEWLTKHIGPRSFE